MHPIADHVIKGPRNANGLPAATGGVAIGLRLFTAACISIAKSRLPRVL